VSAHNSGLTGFDERRRAEIKAATDMSELTDDREHERAQETNRDNLQMGAAIGTVHGMVHGSLHTLSLLFDAGAV
jgi:hypothetical protein